MELRDYLRLIRRRWMILVLSVTVTVAIAALLVLQTTPVYASKATLFVSVTQLGDSATGAYEGGLFSQQRVASYADLVRGESVTRTVVQDLGLSMSPSTLGSKISARVLPETVLLEITVLDTHPAQAQRLTGAVAEQFATFVQDLERPSPDADSPIRATMVDAPTLPSSPTSPNPTRTIGLGLLAGLVLGAGTSILREVLDTSVKSPEALSERTGAPNLGVIAHDSDAHAKPLVVHLEPRSPRAEAFRQLRTNLQFVDVDRHPKRIVVTSSVPSEGKSTTTCNLGLTLAQAGQRVILVEGDIRRPRLGEYLAIESAVGLTSVLIGRVSPEDAIQPWGDIPLDVLASGPLPPNPSELLQSRAMEMLLRELERRADVVLIDAPPLLPVTDAALLARQSDGAVLVVRHGRTSTDQIETAIGNLAKVDARLLGTVLNMAPAKGPEAQTYGYGLNYGIEGGRRRSRGGAPNARVRTTPRTYEKAG
jgi:capsular exopolysaccharide synthesis family protein